MHKTRYQTLCAELSTISPPAREPLKLLVVSKYASTEAIRHLYELGQQDFAENYWQTAQKKIHALTDLKITWHFVGSLQSNKCAEIAQHVSWIHSLSKIKHVRLLAEARPENLPALQICLQVNLSDNPLKHGAAPETLSALIQEVLRYPQLNLRGLMVLPSPGMTRDFLQLATLRDQLEAQFNISLPTLSMGMSQDYQEAIQAGATIIRIGSLLFEN